MPDVLTPLEPHQVEVGGEIGRRIDMTLRRNLLVLDVDRHFLAPFKAHDNAPYVALGKLIDAAVSFAAYTGEADVASFKNHIVRETIRTQEPDGYIGTMQQANRMQENYDVHEMAYIVLGLARNYGRFGDEGSGSAAVRLANFMMKQWGEKREGLTTLGTDEAFLTLSRVTGDPSYLDFCANTPTGRKENAALREYGTGLETHVYRCLARCVAQHDLYRVRPEAQLLERTRDTLNDLTSGDALVITGTCSRSEHWHTDQDGTGELGEACATAYLIRLMDSLIRLEGDLRYGDIVERSIYNALFGALSPDGRRIRYNIPFDGRRFYFDEDPSKAHLQIPSHDLYCCPGNFRRIVAELPTQVYYRSADGLAINLYTSSQATLDLEGGVSLTVRQETDYPNSGRVEITLTPSESTTFPLRLRIPRWCSNARVAVNGALENGGVVGGQFLEIRREWEHGDYVTLDMPMPWRIIRGRKKQEGRVAVMRGPVVYCLSPERNTGLGSGVDLSEITIDSSSVEGPMKDDTVSPDGLKCHLRARRGERDSKQQPDLDLHLTEFPDPTGEAVYFIPSKDIAVDDELVD